MSTGVLALAPIVARIAGLATSLREVGDAAAFGRLTAGKVVTPSAFVIPLADRGGANRYANEPGQPIVAQFGVILAARDIRRDRGTAALSELEQVRDEVRLALLGWTPDGADAICTYVAGRLVSGIGTDGLMFWQEDWATTLDLRSTP